MITANSFPTFLYLDYQRKKALYDLVIDNIYKEKADKARQLLIYLSNNGHQLASNLPAASKFLGKLGKFVGLNPEEALKPVVIANHKLILFETGEFGVLRFPDREKHIFYLDYPKNEIPGVSWDEDYLKLFELYQPDYLLLQFRSKGKRESEIYLISYFDFLNSSVKIRKQKQRTIALEDFTVFPDLATLASLLESKLKKKAA